MNKLTLIFILFSAFLQGQDYRIYTVRSEVNVGVLNIYYADGRGEDFTLLKSVDFSQNMETEVYWDHPCFRFEYVGYNGISIIDDRDNLRTNIRFDGGDVEEVVCMPVNSTIIIIPCVQSVYPNPTYGKLYTECFGSWEIRDENGRTLKKNLTHPDLSDTYFPTGKYYLVFNKKQTFLVIKQ